MMVVDAPVIDKEGSKALLCDLVRIPSHEEHPSYENDLVNFLTDLLAGIGMDVETFESPPGRRNLAAWAGPPGVVRLLLCVHADTVPPYGMENALEPVEKDGRIYGRGACDVKGGMAAMLAALAAVLEKGGLRRRVGFLATAGEEGLSHGMRRFVEDPPEVEYAVVAEPTGLEIGAAHKGVLRLQARFVGKAAHGGVPEEGINAVYGAAEWTVRLRRHYLPLLAARKDSLLGNPTLNVGIIRGGRRLASVPDECVVQFERRYLPEESSAAVVEELKAFTRRFEGEYAGCRVSLEGAPEFADAVHPAFRRPARDDVLVDALGRAAHAVGLSSCPLVGLGYWTEAALVAGVPGIRDVVVFGPGFIEQAHSDEEFIDIDQLHRGAAVYASVVNLLCKEE